MSTTPEESGAILNAYIRVGKARTAGLEPDEADLALVRENERRYAADNIPRSVVEESYGSEPDFEQMWEDRRSGGRTAGPELDNEAADAYERSRGL